MRNINANWNRARSKAAAMLFVAIFSFALVPLSRSDEWDKKTIVTFNSPVEIPGKVLPAGTYVFKLLNSSVNRNTVLVYDKDEMEHVATIAALPDYAMEPTDRPVIRLEERPSGSPEAVKAWFYPGDIHGHEFVYPNRRESELAKQSGQNRLSTRDELNQTPAPTAGGTSAKPSGD